MLSRLSNSVRFSGKPIVNKRLKSPGKPIPTYIPIRLDHSKREVTTYEWWKDKAIVMLVFAITGSSTMAIVRPTLGSFGITGMIHDYHMIIIVRFVDGRPMVV